MLACFDRLLETGHSLIVVEHNLDVIKCADHVIDLGPGAGEDGGRVVAVGTTSVRVLETVARDGPGSGRATCRLPWTIARIVP